MKRLLCAAAALCFLAPMASAEEKLSETPLFSGRDWHRLDKISDEWGPSFKLFLVRGIYEGAYAIDKDNVYEQYGPTVSFRDLVAALDRFYGDDRNDKIPVTYALALLTGNPTGAVARNETSSPLKRVSRSLVSVEKKEE